MTIFYSRFIDSKLRYINAFKHKLGCKIKKMENMQNLNRQGQHFSDNFWKNETQSVVPKPQNPIAAKQALYIKDTRPTKVSLAQGMVFNDKDRIRVYDTVQNKWYTTPEQAQNAGSRGQDCKLFKNSTGKIFHSAAIWVAHQRAIDRFYAEQFGDDLKQNPAAYGTPTHPALMEAIAYDAEDIYGPNRYNAAQTISYQTLGMASGYKHLTLPVLNSVRQSVSLPAIENIVMGSNFYGAYPATFSNKTIHRYRYMNDNGEFDFNSFKKAAEMFDPRTTMFLFDMSTGNNFIGTRRSKTDNENIAQILIDKQFYSDHDIAYPNFDPQFDPDWEIYRLLQQAGAPHGVQSSRGKKDKYASRLAFHHIFLGTADQRTEIFSHLITENRNTFLAMPDTWTYLAEIARDPVLKSAHKEDERTFIEIVNHSRKNLSEALEWQWMQQRSGMFDMINITHEGAEKMGETYGIYAVPARNQNRIGSDNQPVEVMRIKHGLSPSNVEKVANAIRETIQRYPSETGRPNPDIIVAD